MKTEHKAVLDSMRHLEGEGYEVTYLDVKEDGLIDMDAFRAAIRPDTILVSVMAINNEIGVIQDLETISAICHEHGIIFHCDATQAAGKMDLNVDRPQGRPDEPLRPQGLRPEGHRRPLRAPQARVRIECQIHGGGHERGMRSGTLATHQIVGMGEAYRLAKEEMETEMPRLARLRDRLWDGIRNNIPEVYLNGSMEHRSPHNLNVSFAFIEGESLMMAMKDIAVSSGSACTSASLEPSYVLRALGRDDELAHSSIRFTLGRFTTEEEIRLRDQNPRRRRTRLREMTRSGKCTSGRRPQSGSVVRTLIPRNPHRTQH